MNKVINRILSSTIFFSAYLFSLFHLKYICTTLTVFAHRIIIPTKHNTDTHYLLLLQLLFQLSVKASLNFFNMASSNSTTDNESSNPFEVYELFIPVPVRFWLYVILNSLSILCCIFALHHLLFDRTLRQALNNHIIIILLFIGLIYELTSVPFMLHYYLIGDTWTLTPSFASFWTFIDYTCYGAELVGFAWATIERHILIFHQQWVSTKKKCFFVHYLPIITILIYIFTFYFVIVLFPSCGINTSLQPVNGVPVPCTAFDPIIGKYDAICHQIIPTFTIAVFSIGLLLRVLWQKTRLNRSVQWRQQRKMTIQLLSIAMLYLLFNFPRSIIQIYNVMDSTSYLITKTFAHLIFFAVQLIFYFPFVCCASIPDLGKRLKKLFFYRGQQRAIAPISLPTDRPTTKRTFEK